MHQNSGEFRYGTKTTAEHWAPAVVQSVTFGRVYCSGGGGGAERSVPWSAEAPLVDGGGGAEPLLRSDGEGAEPLSDWFCCSVPPLGAGGGADWLNPFWR
jgi:hypothetical protein